MEMNKTTKTMTNDEIYHLAMGFYKNFNGELILPIKVNFYLVKNKKYFIELGQQIEEMKNEICSKYSNLEGENQIKANEELKELSQLKQEVSFYQVSLEDFGEINLSMEQLDILEFMIKEE